MATELNWRGLALANGWQIVDRDPEGYAEEACLFHEDLNRIWPLNDWEGACRDIGLTAEDAAA